MPAAGHQIVLLNNLNGRKEALPDRDIIRLCLALDTATTPTAAQRIRVLAGLVTALLQKDSRVVRQVENPEEAQLTLAVNSVAGSYFTLKVAAPLESETVEPTAFSPAEIDYLLLSAPHQLNLQWSNGALAGARAALTRLKDYLKRLQPEANPTGTLTNAAKKWQANFYEQLCDDLNTPRALAVLWTMLQSELSNSDKYGLLEDFCRTLGFAKALGLPEARPVSTPASPKPPTNTNKATAKNSKPTLADQKAGANAKNAKVKTEARRLIGQTKEVWSRLTEPSRYDFALSIIGYKDYPALKATLESLLDYVTSTSLKVEIIAADMNENPEVSGYLDFLSQTYAGFRTIFCRENLGEAAGRNIALRHSRAKYIIVVRNGLIFNADIFAQLDALLKSETAPTLYGAFPVQTVRTGIEISGYTAAATTSDAPVEVEGLELDFLVIPREKVEEVGLLDERFKIPYALGLDYSYNFRDKGYKVKTLGQAFSQSFSVSKRAANEPTPDEKQRQKNWKLFLQSWDFTQAENLPS